MSVTVTVAAAFLMGLILIYRPLEGGRLSHLGTAVSVQPMSKAAYRSDFREKHRNLSAALVRY